MILSSIVLLNIYLYTLSFNLMVLQSLIFLLHIDQSIFDLIIKGYHYNISTSILDALYEQKENDGIFLNTYHYFISFLPHINSIIILICQGIVSIHNYLCIFSCNLIILKSLILLLFFSIAFLFLTLFNLISYRSTQSLSNICHHDDHEALISFKATYNDT